MADFLTRLAGRTMGLTPTVQPNIAPMYTPDSIVAGDQPGLVVIGEETPGNLTGQQRVPLSPTGDTRQFQEYPVGTEESISIHQDRGEHAHQTISFPTNEERGPVGAQSYFLTIKSVHEEAHDVPINKLKSIIAPIVPVSSDRRRDESRSYEASERISSTRNLPSDDSWHSLQTDTTPKLVPPVPVSHSVPPGQFPARLKEDTSVQVDPLTAQTRTEQEQIGHIVNLPEPSLDSSALRSQQPGMPGIQSISTSAQERGVRGEIRPQGAAHRGEHMGSILADQPQVVEETQSAAPTIQVTIGRIEVRAMPPPTPRPQNQRPASLVMSLEDYLDQRTKGGY